MAESAESTASLSAQELEQYRRDGYLIPRYQLSTGRTDALRATVDRLIAANPGVRPEKLVSAHIEGRNAEGVVGSSDFLDLAHEPAILDMVEQVIGPDIILWGCHIFCKPAGDGLETPFHQDGHYWPIRPLATCTVWVALEPSTRDNGCLQVIPGSHVQQQSFSHVGRPDEELTLNQQIAPDAVDLASAVSIELEPGQMSLHDVYLVHGAAPNRSGRRRTGVALRYMPGSSEFCRALDPVKGQSGVPVQFASRPLWLLRGQDRTGRNDFQIGH